MAVTDVADTHDYGRAHSGGYVTQPEHTLRVSAWSAVAGITLTIAAVVIDETGCPRPTNYPLLPTGDRAKSTSIAFPLECGTIASVHVFASAGAPLGNQCYVRVELLQGREGGVQSLGTILEGYVTANVALAYPGDNTSRAVDGHGTARIVPGTAPAAGAEIVETVPVNTRWALYAFSFQLQTSAAAANRQVVLTIDDGVNIVWESSQNANVVAATLAKFRAGAGVQLATVQANVFQIPLPETLLLPAGARIRTVTAAKDAADQYTAPVYNVEEWLDV